MGYSEALGPRPSPVRGEWVCIQKPLGPHLPRSPQTQSFPPLGEKAFLPFLPLHLLCRKGWPLMVWDLLGHKKSSVPGRAALCLTQVLTAK